MMRLMMNVIGQIFNRQAKPVPSRDVQLWTSPTDAKLSTKTVRFRFVDIAISGSCCLCRHALRHAERLQSITGHLGPVGCVFARCVSN